jgi:hypothetical protein
VALLLVYWGGAAVYHRPTQVALLYSTGQHKLSAAPVCPLADGRPAGCIDIGGAVIVSTQIVIVVRPYNPTVETASLNVRRIRLSISPNATVLVRHFTSLHFTSLHFTSLYFTSLHFTVYS